SVGNAEEGILSAYHRDVIEYIYNEFYSFKEKIVANKKIKRIPFPVELLDRATTILSTTLYQGQQILIKEGQTIVINPEVTIKIINKIDSGLKINQLERIIMDVGIFIARGYQIDGKVNFLSGFNENSFEKNKENQESLSFIQKFKNYIRRNFAVRVNGYSMSGLFEHGDVVGAKKVRRFTRYQLGDIIVFEKNGVNVIHMIVGTETVNGKTQYKTWGVNNPDADRGSVSKNDILGKVVMSTTEQYKILAQARQGKVFIVDALGMVKELENNPNALSIDNDPVNDYNSILSRKSIDRYQYANTLVRILLEGFTKISGQDFSVSELASQLGVTQKTINQWLIDGISHEGLDRINKKVLELRGTDLNIYSLAQEEFIQIEILLDYYYSPYKDYYMGDEMLMENAFINPKELQTYPEDWKKGDPSIQNCQKIIDAKFTGGLSILSGLALRSISKGELHHWETTNKGFNKDNCQLAATILLNKGEHTLITTRTAQRRGLEFQEDWQRYYEDKALYCIVSLMKSQIPKCWIIDNKKANIYDDIKNRENVNGILFLLLRNPKILEAYSDPNFLSRIEGVYSLGILSTNVFNDNDFKVWLEAGKPSLGWYL
ncbi:MAG: signal peptidase I, partial [Candidatus Hermodarchaeota archaeon]